MSFAETRLAVNVERVEIGFILGDRTACSAGKTVAFADDKGIECIFVIAVFFCLVESCFCVGIVVKLRDRIRKADVLFGSERHILSAEDIEYRHPARLSAEPGLKGWQVELLSCHSQ